MNIYCETNFILEIVFSQEQATYCENIISLCKANKVNLIIPAYSFAEAIYRLEKQISLQDSFIEDLDPHIKHFSRTVNYNQQNEQQIQKFKDLEIFLRKNKEELKSRFEKCRNDLVSDAEIIPLDSHSLITAESFQTEYTLSLQDSIIFASTLSHLEQNNTASSCFLNRNASDFNTKEIKSKLEPLNCKLITSFEHGFSYISNEIK
jgi:predicted nucleic acid-binding protein